MSEAVIEQINKSIEANEKVIQELQKRNEDF